MSESDSEFSSRIVEGQSRGKQLGKMNLQIAAPQISVANPANHVSSQTSIQRHITCWDLRTTVLGHFA
jgi:hypothetical protein